MILCITPLLIKGTVTASILFEIFESSLKSIIDPPTESSLVFSLFFPIDCKLTEKVGKPGPVIKLKLTKKEILEKYLNKEYFCYMTGFIAGMPFLGDIDKKIRLERLETPRVKVPKGAVGI